MSIAESGNADRVKQLNRSLVLKAVHQYGPITKAILAEKVNLTIASIGNIISNFKKRGIIKTVGYAKSRGGRPPVLYELNYHHFYVIALDIGVTKIVAAIVNLRGDICYQEIRHIKKEDSMYTLMKRATDIVDQLLVVSGLPLAKILGIGVAAPGPVDEVNGMILSPPNLQGKETLHIKLVFEKRYHLPTIVEKDANAAALAEQWFGNATIDENILFIFADQGIGSGMIIDTNIYRGYKNSAGEIGHVSIDIDGPRCNCGNFGCLEAMVSGIAIIRRVKRELRRGKKSSLSSLYLEKDLELTLELIVEHGRMGDQLVQSILNETGRYLGIGIANAINFFAPSNIIFGGQIVELYPDILPVAEYIAKERSFSKSASNIRFSRSIFGKNSSLMGAAAIIQQRIFSHPETSLLK